MFCVYVLREKMYSEELNHGAIVCTPLLGLAPPRTRHTVHTRTHQLQPRNTAAWPTRTSAHFKALVLQAAVTLLAMDPPQQISDEQLEDMVRACQLPALLLCHSLSRCFAARLAAVGSHILSPARALFRHIPSSFPPDPLPLPPGSPSCSSVRGE